MMRHAMALILLGWTLLEANTLYSLIESAQKSERSMAYKARHAASKLSERSLETRYLPTLDLGASGTWLDEPGSFDAGESYRAYAKVQAVLFDGFRRENAIKEAQKTVSSELFAHEGFKKAVALTVSELYFERRNLEGDMDAMTQKIASLDAELANRERFYTAGLATTEEIERIKAEAASSRYRLAALEYERESVLSQLFVLCGKTVSAGAESHISEPVTIVPKELDVIGELRNQRDAALYRAKSSDAGFMPSLVLEDTYTFYKYRNDRAAGFIERVDQQNNLTLALSMNLMDRSGTKAREALMAQRLAFENELAYQSREATASLELSRKAVKRSRAQIGAAKLSLDASLKTYESVEKKYHAKLVDYVAYLDALYQKSEALSQYNRALNGLEVAFARYYYYAGYDIKEFVR